MNVSVPWSLLVAAQRTGSPQVPEAPLVMIIEAIPLRCSQQLSATLFQPAHVMYRPSNVQHLADQFYMMGSFPHARPALPFADMRRRDEFPADSTQPQPAGVIEQKQPILCASTLSKLQERLAVSTGVVISL